MEECATLSYNGLLKIFDLKANPPKITFAFDLSTKSIEKKINYTSVEWCINDPEIILIYSESDLHIITRDIQNIEPPLIDRLKFSSIIDAGFLPVASDCICHFLM